MQSWKLPKTGATLSKKHGQLNRLFDELKGKIYDPIKWGYGGLRIEVRVNTPTLAYAKFKVLKLKLLSWENLNSINFYKVILLNY
jgi:hypothetical protein